MQSFQEHINTVEPDQRFEHIVRDILRDKESKWSHNYYANPLSHYYKDVIKYSTSVAVMQQTINKNNKTLRELDLQIKKSKLNPKDPDYKPLKKAELEKIDATYTEVAKENIYLYDDLNNDKRELNKYTYLDYIYSRTNKNIYTLRNKFQIDGNLDHLRKGITLTFLRQYADLDLPLPQLPKNSFSAW